MKQETSRTLHAKQCTDPAHQFLVLDCEDLNKQKRVNYKLKTLQHQQSAVNHGNYLHAQDLEPVQQEQCLLRRFIRQILPCFSDSQKHLRKSAAKPEEQLSCLWHGLPIGSDGHPALSGLAQTPSKHISPSCLAVIRQPSLARWPQRSCERSRASLPIPTCPTPGQRCVGSSQDPSADGCMLDSCCIQRVRQLIQWTKRRAPPSRASLMLSVWWHCDNMQTKARKMNSETRNIQNTVRKTMYCIIPILYIINFSLRFVRIVSPRRFSLWFVRIVSPRLLDPKKHKEQSNNIKKIK